MRRTVYIQNILHKLGTILLSLLVKLGVKRPRIYFFGNTILTEMFSQGYVFLDMGLVTKQFFSYRKNIFLALDEKLSCCKGRKSCGKGKNVLSLGPYQE